jgi:hypothetical protein
MYLEPFLLGFLNGFSLGEDKEIWKADGRMLSRDSVYFWVDNYCLSHATDSIFTAAITLFRERSAAQ